MNRFAFLFLLVLACRAATAASTESLTRRGIKVDSSGKIVQPPEEPLSVRAISAKLPPQPYPKATMDGFYEEIPKNLEQAVRYIAQENYTSAAILLVPELAAAKDPRERARVLMWLGIMTGQHCLDNPTAGPVTGTSATLYLLQAAKIDPKVLEASDATRILAEMAAHGWGVNTPLTPTVVEEAEKRAETSQRALDYFYAGLMSRREAIKQWLYGDTSKLDKRAYKMLSRAVEIEPTRYEFWVQYLTAMMPVGLHEHMTSESARMYEYFRPLRNPLIADPGPGALHLRTRQGYTMADDDKLLNDLIKERPREPFAHFQLALWAIETTPTLAVQGFEKFIADVENGRIEMLPREAGFYPSAVYKLAFLYEEAKGTTESLRLYEKVKSISPSYAEVNGNLATIYARMSEDATTPTKIALLEKALELAKEQEKYNYRGKAASKAIDMRRKVQLTLRKLRQPGAANPAPRK